MTKRVVGLMHEQGTAFGLMDVVISDKTLEVRGAGRIITFRRGGFGDERAAEAFKGFVEARPARSAP